MTPTPWVLVTGNGAYGDTAVRSDFRYDENPSSTVACALDGEVVEGHRVVGRSIDWELDPAEALAPLMLDGVPPVAVIGCGVFSGRTTVTVERVAVNVQDFQFEDGGRRPAGEPIVPGGAPAYLATLPIKAMARAMRAAGVPALISNSASTHGCNSVMYAALRIADEKGLPLRCGFVHLPDPPEHVAQLRTNGPSMSLDLQIRAVRAGIEATITHPVDIVDPVNEWEW